MLGTVVYQGVVVHALLLVGYHATVEVRLGSFAVQHQIGTIARLTVVQGNVVEVHHAAALLPHIHVAETPVLHVCLLQFIQLQTGVFCRKDFHHLGGQEIAVVHRMVAEEQPRLRVFFQYDQYAAVGHQIHVGTQDVHHLQRTFHHHATRHVNEESVLRQHRVQRINRVFLRTGQFAVAGRHPIGIILGRLLQGAYHHAFGQRGGRQRLPVKSVVHHKIKRSAQVRHVAPEGLVRIDGKLYPVQVQPVVRCKGRRHVRIFIAFHFLRRETLAGEILKSLVAQGVHRPCTMAVEHFPASGENIYVLLFAIHCLSCF